MKTIPLTQGQVALVDDLDFAGLSAHKWFAWRGKAGTFYAVRQKRTPRGQRLLRMHRVLLPGVPRVDHWNRNTLDNQRRNLRPATSSQNMANSGRYKSNTSGYKGVSWHNGHARWHAEVVLAQRHYHLGYFDDLITAARAYDAA